MPTYIHGIAASSNLDSSGERIIIDGLDISTLSVDGVFSYEHESPTKIGETQTQIKVPSQIVGKVLRAKKIFGEKDCDTEAESYFWQKCKTPYVYVMGELFDDYHEGAKELAGLFRYDADHKGRNQTNVMNFSIEGGRLAKEGTDITKSIARKVTLTVHACNKMAIAEMVKNPDQKKPKDDLETLFRSETSFAVEVFKSDRLTEVMNKTEDRGCHAEALGIVPVDKEEISQGASTALSGVGPSSPSLSCAEDMSRPGASAHQTPRAQPMAQIKAKGWKPNVASTLKTKVATYEHPEHGIVTVRHNPANRRFEVMHAGKMAGLKGQKGSFGDAKAALEHAHNYMSSVSAGTTAGHRMYNVSSDKVVPPKIQKSQQQAGARIPTSRNETNEPMKPIKKAMEAGSGMAAPGNLVGGAALAKEDKLNKPVFSTTKGKDLRSGLPGLKSGAGTSYMGAHVRQGNMERARDIAKKTLKDKSKWLARAEEEYKNWQKREQFEDFMSKKMPHLTKGEVQAIGQCLALSKVMKLEKSLSRMSPDYSGDYKAQSYVNKAEDELLKGFVLMASEGSREEMKKFSDQLMATEEGRALKKLFPF